MKDKVATTDMLTTITTTATTAIINKPVQYAFMYCNSPSAKRQRSIRSGILRQKRVGCSSMPALLYASLIQHG
jgi:hypothetical protein